MDAVILSIGTELTTGSCVDTNAPWLAKQLCSLGWRVTEQMTVGDDISRLAQAIRRGLCEADLVLATGGLGPTVDDVTRAALSEALGDPLEESPAAMAQIRAFFEQRQIPMPASNRRQGLLPRGCTVVVNARGTAPGICYQTEKVLLFALPGVPAEMRAMFESSLAPELEGCSRGARRRSATLRTFGMNEAQVGEAIADLMDRDRNPLVGVTASGTIISVRITAHGPGSTGVDELLRTEVNEIRHRLGHAVFGEGETSLQGAVAALLRRHGKTIATAESCTGGLLAKRLTDVAGSSAYFLRGYVTYSNQAKIDLLAVPQDLIRVEGVVSEAVARAMVCGCRSSAEADIALSITGVAGPSGGHPPTKPVGLVFVGLADDRDVVVKRLLLGEHLSRAEIRDRSCKVALNLLRLRLLCLSEH